jgi:hypothetical protein
VWCVLPLLRSAACCCCCLLGVCLADWLQQQRVQRTERTHADRQTEQKTNAYRIRTCFLHVLDSNALPVPFCCNFSLRQALFFWSVWPSVLCSRRGDGDGGSSCTRTFTLSVSQLTALRSVNCLQ